MHTTPTNLKVQIFSLVAGILYVFAFLLVVANQSAAASDLDPRDDLDRVIEKRLGAELEGFGARFDHRFASNSRHEKHAALPNPKIVLADEQAVDLKRDDYEYRANR